MELAQTLVAILLGYAGIGLVFGVAFALRGAQRLDPAAADGTWGFRVLLVPGAAALWPLLLARWVRGSGKPVERNAHRDAAPEVRT